MHSRVRSASLTETLGIRVTEDERNTLEKRAAEAGISLNEWCRQLLLDGISVSTETRLILSEVLSVRKVFLALMLDQIQGQKPTESRVREVVDNAEATKFAMAESRIHAFRSSNRNESK
jgi:hypothetical protein